MYIYKILNKLNNKVYIGKAKNLKQRIQKHLHMAKKKTNRHLYDAINHYGWENFEVLVIEKCNVEEANKKEIYWIKFFDSTNRDKGYNMTIGGDGGNSWKNNMHKKETSEKIRQAHLGRKHTEESKKKMSEASRGRTVTDETKQKLSRIVKEDFKLGKRKINLPKVLSGKDHPRYGIPHTKETREKISKARLGKTWEMVYSPESLIKIRQTNRENWLGDNNPNRKHKPKSYIDLKIEDIKNNITNCKTIKDLSIKLNININTLKNKMKKFKIHFVQLRNEVNGEKD